jgi:hypothetical protein
MTIKLFFSRDSEGRVSLEQVRKVKCEWTNIAMAQLQFDIVNNTFYAYGSELACLRLLKEFRNNEYARQSYSDNLETHFFSMDFDYCDIYEQLMKGSR